MAGGPPHLHHVLEDVGLSLRVAVPLGFADDAVVLEEEDVAVVAPRGGPDARGPLPHLERPLVQTNTIRQKHDAKHKTSRADWFQDRVTAEKTFSHYVYILYSI